MVSLLSISAHGGPSFTQSGVESITSPPYLATAYTSSLFSPWAVYLSLDINDSRRFRSLNMRPGIDRILATVVLTLF